MPKNTYTLKDGTIVPGTTTICSQLAKGDALLDWAWNLGVEGKPWRDERDNKGKTGNAVHNLILKFLTGEDTIMPVGMDGERFKKFQKWWREETKERHLETICETPLVSEKYWFGGQADIYIVTTDKLIDIKTGGKWVYDEWWYQLAGYAILLKEHGYKPREKQILWIPKNGFECPVRDNLDAETRIFLHLLGIWYDRRSNE